jgi:hypothetical protein
MPKKVIWIVLSIIIAIGAGFTYLLLNQDDDSGKRTTSSTSSDSDTKEQADTPGTDTETAANGRYIDYREDSIANTAGTKLLFFHAPWCPQCRDLESDIKASGVRAA